MRESEICGISEDQIDLDRRILTVKEQMYAVFDRPIEFRKLKTPSSVGTLPISPSLEKVIRDRLSWIKKNRLKYGMRYHTEHQGRLSVNKMGGLCRPTAVYQTFREILSAQDEIPVIHFHDLRHTAAVWLLSEGVHMKTLQMILRHSTYEITANTYSHVTDNLKEEALSSLILP